MSLFDKLISGIFGTHKVNSTIPLVEEEIKRHEAYRSSYFKWVNEGKYRWLTQKIYQNYLLKKKNEAADLQVHLLKSSGAGGFAVTYSLLMDEKELQYLFDYLKDKVLNLNYKLYTSDRRIFDRKEYVETIEKHYLKPITERIAPTGSEHPENKEMINQRYGNILIEYISVDEKPSFLRFMVHYYSDFLYTPVQSFDDLVDYLLD
ncbi:MAG: hypothetical protein EAZ08_12555 [Cytophagales bacterium]|nr:MAG: hypothetical protein EAZ08_12555 [Cytophagales bacterium]